MKKITIAMLVFSVALGVYGCEKEKGPMERAGERIDESVDKVLHPNEGPLEKAGRKTEEAVEDLKDEIED
ncbi:MAG: hypothetical protein ABR538_12690 [Candidatus Binatia bacterium]